MDSPSVEVVRRAVDLAAQGRWDAAMELLAPDVEWVIAKQHPEARTLTGSRAVVEYRRAWQDAMPDMRLELDRLVERGETVVAIGAVVGTAIVSGAELRTPLAIVYRVRNGLIARAEEYLDPDEALDAAGDGAT